MAYHLLTMTSITNKPFQIFTWNFSSIQSGVCWREVLGDKMDCIFSFTSMKCMIRMVPYWQLLLIEPTIRSHLMRSGYLEWSEYQYLSAPTSSYPPPCCSCLLFLSCFCWFRLLLIGLTLTGLLVSSLVQTTCFHLWSSTSDSRFLVFVWFGFSPFGSWARSPGCSPPFFVLHLYSNIGAFLHYCLSRLHSFSIYETPRSIQIPFPLSL